MTKPIYTCMWFDGQAKAAAEFYCQVFNPGKIISESPVAVVFEIHYTRFMALNGGPQFKPTEATSFVVECSSQETIDHYWNQLTANGGQAGRCGWLKDKYGFSWQIIPEKLGALLAEPGAMQALMTMNKIDIYTLENASAPN